MSDQQISAPNQRSYPHLHSNLCAFKLDEHHGIGTDCCSIPELKSSATAIPLLLAFEDDDVSANVEEVTDGLLVFESDGEEDNQESDLDIPREDLRARTLRLLELVALSFLQQVSSTQIELTLVSRTKTTQEYGSVSHRLMRWPKKTKNGSFRRFACLFRVIDLICEALTIDVPTTKREMFYQDVSLFKSQTVVDNLVDDLAATIGVTRADLNVRASAKGLFCGSGLKIHLRHGGVIHGTDAEGALIPAGVEISRLRVDDTVSWVLVVEKEAVFQMLCRVGFSSNTLCPGPGIIITGKGYPDLATRELVGHLSRSFPPSIPILALVDADAHGLEILSVYKYGSQKLSHEGPKVIAPRLEWMGVYGSELSNLGIDRDKLIPLTKHDHKKALEMLRRDDTVMQTQWRKELSHMLHSRRKAEIEIISSIPTTQHSVSQKYFFQEDDKPAKEPLLVQYLASKLHIWINLV